MAKITAVRITIKLSAKINGLADAAKAETAQAAIRKLLTGSAVLTDEEIEATNRFFTIDEWKEDFVSRRED